MTEDASPPVVVNGTAPAAASTTKGAGTTPTTTGHPMIVPPPEIRRIVEKTAEYYLRGGRALEDKIRVENAANVKFAFLNPNDPYHPYYRAQVEVVMRRSRGEEVEGGVAGAKRDFEAEEEAAAKKAKLEEEEAAAAAELDAAPAEPPAFEFCAKLPAISVQDFDIIKLTALFVARNGRAFMTALTQREAKNIQFEFMQPRHSMFPLFTQLLEQYTRVLQPPADLKQRLDVLIDDRFGVLDRCFERVDWQRYQERTVKEAEEIALAENELYNSVDWHDFVVVQQIEFTDAEESMVLPPPTSIAVLQSIPLAQRKQMIDVQIAAPVVPMASAGGADAADMDMGE